MLFIPFRTPPPQSGSLEGRGTGHLPVGSPGHSQELPQRSCRKTWGRNKCYGGIGGAGRKSRWAFRLRAGYRFEYLLNRRKSSPSPFLLSPFLLSPFLMLPCFHTHLFLMHSCEGWILERVVQGGGRLFSLYPKLLSTKCSRSGCRNRLAGPRPATGPPNKRHIWLSLCSGGSRHDSSCLLPPSARFDHVYSRHIKG